MRESTQITLTGKETDKDTPRPTTIIRCLGCGERVLRSRVRTHADDHDALPRPRWGNQFVSPTDEEVVGDE